MKTRNAGLRGWYVGVAFFCLVTGVQAQTAGNLTFTCKTDAPSGSWGNKHVLAIWIENSQNPSNFIQTNAKYGHEDDHLTAWVAKSGKNLVDAVTGATLSSYGTQSVIWDGTDIDHQVVEDGIYNVLIEMGWGRDKKVQHSVLSFSFSKSDTVTHLTPDGNSNYSDVSIDWVPTVTLVKEVNRQNEVSVFPNPAPGKFQLHFSENVAPAMVEVENTSGVNVFQKTLERGFSGILRVDLSSNAKGLYVVKITTPEKQYAYKIFLTE